MVDEDSIIDTGFPDGWFIQDRPKENTALLVYRTPGMWPGTACLCLRPRAMTTKEWLPTAKQIAATIALTQKSRALLEAVGRYNGACFSGGTDSQKTASARADMHKAALALAAVLPPSKAGD